MKPLIHLGFVALALALYGCREAEPAAPPAPDPAPAGLVLPAMSGPVNESAQWFRDAEAQAAAGRPTTAARRLHQGIIFYRRETGSVHGRSAAHINQAIGDLTRLRSRLRRGELVDVQELHRAILQAQEKGPKPHPAAPGPDHSLVVPVGGN